MAVNECVTRLMRAHGTVHVRNRVYVRINLCTRTYTGIRVLTVVYACVPLRKRACSYIRVRNRVNACVQFWTRAYQCVRGCMCFFIVRMCVYTCVRRATDAYAGVRLSYAPVLRCTSRYSFLPFSYDCECVRMRVYARVHLCKRAYPCIRVRLLLTRFFRNIRVRAALFPCVPMFTRAYVCLRVRECACAHVWLD